MRAYMFSAVFMTQRKRLNLPNQRGSAAKGYKTVAISFNKVHHYFLTSEFYQKCKGDRAAKRIESIDKFKN